MKLIDGLHNCFWCGFLVFRFFVKIHCIKIAHAPFVIKLLNVIVCVGVCEYAYLGRLSIRESFLQNNETYVIVI